MPREPDYSGVGQNKILAKRIFGNMVNKKILENVWEIMGKGAILL